MNCKCTKCSSSVLIDPTKVSENGGEVKCSECNSCLYLFKESFAGRALYKSGEIYCSHCAGRLDHTIVCPECKAIYPDYFVIRSTKRPRIRSTKSERSFIAFPKSAPVRKNRISNFPEIKKVRSNRAFKVLGSVIVIVALALGGLYGYTQHRSANQYAFNFMRALYGIKSGADTCEEIAADLKIKMDTQRFASIRLGREEEARLKLLKSRVDKLMTELNSPPNKFIKSDKQIRDIYNIYARLNSVTLERVGSPKNYFASASKLQDDFSEGIKDLKATMPPRLSEEFKIAQAKYKPLQNI